jgi:hypothetical protein
MNPPREPLEVETLVSSDARRLSVAEHQDWRQAAFPPARPALDEIDELLAEMREIQPEGQAQ